MNNIYDLIEISKYAGERFDLVQAGGGNSSVKLDNGEMIIKASGFLLSDLGENSGYSRVNTRKTARIIKDKNILNSHDKRERETLASYLVKDATLDHIYRPSIETLLHSLLLKFTLHTHPIIVNMIAVRKDYKDIFNEIFKNDDILLVDYQTPGIELAIILGEELKSKNRTPKIIFLKNHGLIVTSNNKDDIKNITEYVLNKIENYLNVDMSRYKLTNKITSVLNRVEKNLNITYLSEDSYLNECLDKNKDLFLKKPFCPDSLVYCGIGCVNMKSLENIEPIALFKDKYMELPKVLIFNNKLFFIASNIKKAKEMEEVFKFSIMVLENNKDKAIDHLSLDELGYLSNWEAEQYRQKL